MAASSPAAAPWRGVDQARSLLPGSPPESGSDQELEREETSSAGLLAAARTLAGAVGHAGHRRRLVAATVIVVGATVLALAGVMPAVQAIRHARLSFGAPSPSDPQQQTGLDEVAIGAAAAPRDLQGGVPPGVAELASRVMVRLGGHLVPMSQAGCQGCMVGGLTGENVSAAQREDEALRATMLGSAGKEESSNVLGMGGVLSIPSDGKLMDFYIYRAISDAKYAPLNVNAANLPGVLWYLHNEVVKEQPRKFGITRIQRYRVRVLAPQPLLDKGMNFGVRYAFDSGQCTGPWNCTVFWRRYGFFVGCNNLGDFPYPDYPVSYPGGIWYSFPGPCPSEKFFEESAECRLQQPGGASCGGSDSPSGTGDCVYTWEEAGDLGIDEMVGIDDYDEFVRSGKREYIPSMKKGWRFDWWNDLNSVELSTERLEKARAKWAAKYPEMPKDEDLPSPTCDFDFDKFFDAEPEHRIEHEGEDCWDPCGARPGSCPEFCGRGNACCRYKAQFDPPECDGVVRWPSKKHHTCVVEQAAHAGEDCWEPCKGPGNCSGYCGEGNACCRYGAHFDPPICRHPYSWPTRDHHTCIVPR